MDFVNFVRNQWDRVGAWVCIAAGALTLLLGWRGVSGTPYPAEQIPYIVSGGLVGVFLLGLGAVLWLSADLRDEWRKLDAIERLAREAGQLPLAPPVAQNGHAVAPSEDDVAELEVVDEPPRRTRRARARATT